MDIYIYIPIFIYNAIFIYTVVGCNCCLVFGVTTNMFPFKHTYFCTLRPLRMSLGRFFTRTRNPFLPPFVCEPETASKNQNMFWKKTSGFKINHMNWNARQCLFTSYWWCPKTSLFSPEKSFRICYLTTVVFVFRCNPLCPRWNILGYLVLHCFFSHVFPSPIKTPAGFSRRLWYKLNFTRRKTNKPLEAPNTLTCTECAGLLRLRGRHCGRIGQIGTPRLYGFQPSGFHSRRTRAHCRHAECIGFTVTPPRTWWVDVVCRGNHLQLTCFKGLTWWIF